MNLVLRFARFYVPPFLKKQKLEELFRLTAEAFGCEPPPIRKLGYGECLQAYAQFSRGKAEEALQQPEEIESLKERLYRNAFRMGESLRKSLGVRTRSEMIMASRVLYRILKIELTANTSSEVTIEKCFFSRYYTAPVCEILSALDEGVAAGLSGGGRLVFHERITEGKPCCKAELTLATMPWEE